jgi:acylphosphatase
MSELRKITLNAQVNKVDFIYYAELLANKNQLSGFVQNTTPEQLYLEVEGDTVALNSFENVFLSRFMLKHIQKVTIEKDVPVGYSKFEYRRIRKQVVKTNGIGKQIRFLANFFISL